VNGISRGWVLATTGCLTLAMMPAAGASEAGTYPSARKPPARTVVVRVLGLPTATTPKVKVRGPANYRKTLKVADTRTLQNLRPGTYRLRAMPVTIFTGQPAKASKPRRTVSVTKAQGARVTFSYNAPGTS
jgi:hypothetical protein